MSNAMCARMAATIFGAAAVFLGAGCGGDDGTGASSYQATVKAQTDAEDKLKSQGAKLERKEYPPGDAWVVDLSGKEINEETWTALQGLDRIAELNLSGTKVSDDQIKKVNPLSGLLIDLNLSNTSIGDAGLEQLEAMRLMQLDVSKTRVTADGVAQVLKKRKENPQILVKDLKIKQ